MPENAKPIADSFSKLKDLINKASPQSLLKSIPNTIQKAKGKKDQRGLQRDLKNVDKRHAELGKLEVDNKNKVKEARLEALKKIYATMETLGVDPSSLESIAQFREKLMQEDPDLAELFFNAFDTLTKGIEDDQAASVPPDDLLGQSITNLQEPILRESGSLPPIPPGQPAPPLPIPPLRQ